MKKEPKPKIKELSESESFNFWNDKITDMGRELGQNIPQLDIEFMIKKMIIFFQKGVYGNQTVAEVETVLEFGMNNELGNYKKITANTIKSFFHSRARQITFNQTAEINKRRTDEKFMGGGKSNFGLAAIISHELRKEGTLTEILIKEISNGHRIETRELGTNKKIWSYSCVAKIAEMIELGLDPYFDIRNWHRKEEIAEEKEKEKLALIDAF